jgi:hypothetical protein
MSNRLRLKSRQSLQGLLSARTCQNTIDYQFYVALHICVPLHGSDTSIYRNYTIFSSQHSRIAAQPRTPSLSSIYPQELVRMQLWLSVSQFYIIPHIQSSDASIYRSCAIFSSQPLLYSCTAARAAFVIHSFTRTCQNVTLVISFMVLHRSELECFNISELHYI